MSEGVAEAVLNFVSAVVALLPDTLAAFVIICVNSRGVSVKIYSVFARHLCSFCAVKIPKLQLSCRLC